MEDVKDSQTFAQMPFESTTNTMKGHFTYSTLLPRLKKIRQVIDEETAQWVDQGPKMKEKNERVASNLSSQFLQCHRWFGENPGGVTLNLEMENDNPFVWRMVWNILFSVHLNHSFRIRVVYFSSFYVFHSCFLCPISRFWFLSF